MFREPLLMMDSMTLDPLTSQRIPHRPQVRGWDSFLIYLVQTNHIRPKHQVHREAALPLAAAPLDPEALRTEDLFDLCARSRILGNRLKGWLRARTEPRQEELSIYFRQLKSSWLFYGAVSFSPQVEVMGSRSSSLIVNP
jgi:hypothetical protein